MVVVWWRRVYTASKGQLKFSTEVAASSKMNAKVFLLMCDEEEYKVYKRVLLKKVAASCIQPRYQRTRCQLIWRDENSSSLFGADAIHMVYL